MSRRTSSLSALLVAVAALALSARSASESETTGAASAPDTSATQGAVPAELQFTSTTLDGEPFGVPTTSDEASMLQFVNDFGVGALTNVVDEDGSIWSDFGVPQLPSSVVIYPDGFVTALPGSLTKEQILEIADARGA